MPLGHKNYLEQKATEKQQMQNKVLYLCFICLKAGHTFPLVKVHPVPRRCPTLSYREGQNGSVTGDNSRLLSTQRRH